MLKNGNLKYFVIYLGTCVRSYTSSFSLSFQRVQSHPVYGVQHNIELLPHRINWDWNLKSISELILYEDDSVLILYKPPTILSQSNSKLDDSLYDACKYYLGEQESSTNLDLIHRIDQPCSGVILFSKDSRGTAFLNSQFHDRRVNKIYYCIVNGEVAGKGECNHLLQKSTSSKIRVFDMNCTRKDLVEASLSYEVIVSRLS